MLVDNQIGAQQHQLATNRRTLCKIQRIELFEDTHIEMMIIAAFWWGNRLVLAEAEVATAAAATTTVTACCNATYQEQRLKEKKVLSESLVDKEWSNLFVIPCTSVKWRRSKRSHSLHRIAPRCTSQAIRSYRRCFVLSRHLEYCEPDWLLWTVEIMMRRERVLKVELSASEFLLSSGKSRVRVTNTSAAAETIRNHSLYQQLQDYLDSYQDDTLAQVFDRFFWCLQVLRFLAGRGSGTASPQTFCEIRI